MYIERAQDDSCETQKQWHRFLHGALSFFFVVGLINPSNASTELESCFCGLPSTGFKMLFCSLGL